MTQKNETNLGKTFDYIESLLTQFPTFSDIEFVPPYEDELGQKFSNKFNQETDEILRRFQELKSWWYKKTDTQLDWSLNEMTILQRKFSSAHSIISERLAHYEANEIVRRYLKDNFSNEMNKSLFLKKFEEKWTEVRIKSEYETSAKFIKLQQEYMESIRYTDLCKQALGSIRILIGNISQDIATMKHSSIEAMHNMKHSIETAD